MKQLIISNSRLLRRLDHVSFKIKNKIQLDDIREVFNNCYLLNNLRLNAEDAMYLFFI